MGREMLSYFSERYNHIRKDGQTGGDILDYNFYMPTKIIAGKDCIFKNASVFTSLGKKAMIVTGAHSAKQNGSLDDVLRALQSVGIASVVFDKIMSNPTIAIAYEGAALAKKEKVQFIIAIGGGSPMDAGKAIALLASQTVKEEDLFSGNYKDTVLPMAFVPTTAGTGSEVTQYSILTNDKAQTKTSIASPVLFPTVAFLDAKYMMSLNKTTTINTAVDALSHAVEGMLSVRANAMSDFYAAESIQTLADSFEDLKSGTLTYERREKLLYASTLAGIVIAHTGTTAVHSMGYSLTYFKNVDHGRANGLLLANFLDFVLQRKPERVYRILSLLGVSSVDGLRAILGDLLETKEKVTVEEIEKYASISIKAKNIVNCIAIATEKDLQEMYKASLDVQTKAVKELVKA